MFKRLLLVVWVMSCLKSEAKAPSFRIHNRTEHALQIEDRGTILPGKSLRVYPLEIGPGYTWGLITISYRGADPRFSGLAVKGLPLAGELSLNELQSDKLRKRYPADWFIAAIPSADWEIVSRVDGNPDSDSGGYTSDPQRIFGFEIRERD